MTLGLTLSIVVLTLVLFVGEWFSAWDIIFLLAGLIPLPTIGILVIAIATLEADGLLMFIGYTLVGLNTAVFGSLVYLLWQSSNGFMHWMN